MNLPLDPSKYDNVAGGMAVRGNIVVGTAQGSFGPTQEVVAWDVSNINAPQSIDLLSCLSTCSPFDLGYMMSVGTAVSGNVIVGTVWISLAPSTPLLGMSRIARFRWLRTWGLSVGHTGGPTR